MKTILIIGCEGFTGRHLARFIFENKLNTQYRFVGVDRNAKQEGSVFEQYFSCDCLAPGCVDEVLRSTNPNYIINLSGAFGEQSWEDLYRSNVGISKSILDYYAGHENQVDKIMLIGSAAEYGIDQANPISESAIPKPVSNYGISKLFQTCLGLYYFAQYELPIVIARTFNILGPGLSPALAPGNFEKQIERANDGDSILVGNILNRRDYLKVESVVDAYWAILIYGCAGQIYNVCSGLSVTVESVLRKMIEESGKRIEVHQDLTFKKTGDISDIFGDRSKLDTILLRRNK